MPGAREAVIEPFNVGPACVGERFIFGAERPGYPSDPVDDEAVDEWIALMRSEGVERVVCLLDREQLADYAHDLRDAYREHSGEDRVLWVPISDFSLVDEQTLATVLAFLEAGVASCSRMRVHCSAGSGRTGQILAAWLVVACGRSPAAALEAVRCTHAQRDPGESGNGAQLEQLLRGLAPLPRDG